MGFSINMTPDEIEEATAARPGFEAMPAGEYVAAITDSSIEEVKKSGENFGKPYGKLELTVQDHPEYGGRKLWTNVMLFPGKSQFMIAGLLKAVGHEEWLSGELPDDFLSEIEGEDFIVVVKKKLDTYKMDEYKDEHDGQTSPTKIYKNEVNGFKALDSGELPAGAGGKAKGNNLLP